MELAMKGEDIKELSAGPFWCAVCRDARVQAQGDTCPQCQADKLRGYSVRSLGGRCANGAEADHGTRFHALPVAGSEYGDRTDAAVCGARPGRRSIGWTRWGSDQAVTCPKCIKKVNREVERVLIVMAPTESETK